MSISPNRTNFLNVGEKLMHDIEESTQTIIGTLADSKEANEKFRSTWKSSMEAYVMEVSKLEKELESLPPSYDEFLQLEKGRKETTQKTKMTAARNRSRKISEKIDKKSTTHHALNFHLTCDENKLDDIFILPQEMDNEAIDLNEGDSDLNNDVDTLCGDATSASSTINNTSIEKVDQKKRKILEAQKRFNSRVVILEKIEHMRHSEEELEKRIFGRDACCTDALKENEKIKLMADLDQCRIRNCKTLVRMITTYKTRVPLSNRRERRMLGKELLSKKEDNSSMAKRLDIAFEERIKLLGLNLPKIGEILNDIDKAELKKGVAGGTSYNFEERSTSNNSIKSILDHNEKWKEGYKRKVVRKKTNKTLNETKTLVPTNLDQNITKQLTDKKMKDIISDHQQLSNIHELEVKKPLTSNSKASDIVKENTYNFHIPELCYHTLNNQTEKDTRVLSEDHPANVIIKMSDEERKQHNQSYISIKMNKEDIGSESSYYSGKCDTVSSNISTDDDDDDYSCVFNEDDKTR